MLTRIIAGLLVFAATTVFGMSLSQVNKASKSELVVIKGVGDTKAAAIIKERRKGMFKSFADLSERVKGIGEQIAANIKNNTKAGDKAKKVAKKKKTTQKKKPVKKAKTTAKKRKTKTKTKTKKKKPAPKETN